MAPLILHNVPDDELYVGEDGIQRPYALVFPQQDGIPAASRGRRGALERGSFGKSTRRSRSKAGTPARGIRDDPSIAAADKIWGDWKQTRTSAAPTTANTTTGSNQRKQGMRAASQSLGREDSSSSAPPQPRIVNTPTEIILRGYKSANQQYSAVSHYESLAGRICEDYPREPPTEMRRYKSDLRDTAMAQYRNLTTEERAKVNRADGGEHWVKVTFESSHAADKAVYSSPQRILCHLVYAEPYRGTPPSRDEALPESQEDTWGGNTPLSGHQRTRSQGGQIPTRGIRMNNGMPDWGSLTSDSATATASDSATATTATVTKETPPGSTPVVAAQQTTSTGMETTPDMTYSRRIPSARRAQILPAEDALMPQQSYAQRMMNRIPFVKWFTGNMIGNEVPRTDTGDFDWNRASLYWKFIWWLDATFCIFGGDILSADKDD